MTVLNFIGFQNGNLREGVTSAAAAVQSTVKRSGGYALRVNPAGVNNGYLQFNSIAATGAAVNFNHATLYFRFYIRIDTLPVAASEEIFAANATSQRKFSIRVTSAGKLQAYDKSGTTQLGSDGATVLKTGAWYRIECKVGTGAPGPYEIKINGVSELSGTGDLYTSNNAVAFLGKATNRNNNAIDYYFADVSVDDAAYPGPGSCLAKRVVSDGTYTAYTIGAGIGDKWQQVDETPSDDETTYLLSTMTAGQAYTAALQSCAAAGINGKTINAVKAVVEISVASGAGMSRVRLRSGATDSDTTDVSYTTGYKVMAKVAVTDPATATPWTISGLDGVQVGNVERSTTIQTHLTAIYLMVDFVPLEVAGAVYPGMASHPPMWGTF